MGLDVLRFSTAGSVDDGKSTLIGRLLYDSKAIPDDQYEAVRRASGQHDVDLSLLTDGLRAEREQKITIDVAYRFFATAKRKFIIADTPGHAQYTRNMVTGASHCDLAVVLVDARHGLVSQTRRHSVVASLLGLPHVVLAVNKMDLVGFDQARFQAIAEEYEAYARELGFRVQTAIPVSALLGDNVVDPSANMPWYHGRPLLDYLETAEVEDRNVAAPFRLFVQTVIRPHQDFRGFAGTVSSGSIRPGDSVLAAPGGHLAKATEILGPDGPMAEASCGDAVVIRLDQELGISRGDLLASPSEPPELTDHFTATLCWMSETPLAPGRRYTLAIGSRRLSVIVNQVDNRLEVEDLSRTPAKTLELNEIGRASLRASGLLAVDPYSRATDTGAFLLIDPFTHVPVAAGMVEGLASAGEIGLSNSFLSRRRALFGHGPQLFVAESEESAERFEASLAALGVRTALVVPEAIVGGRLSPVEAIGVLLGQGLVVVVAVGLAANDARLAPFEPVRLTADNAAEWISRFQSSEGD